MTQKKTNQIEHKENSNRFIIKYSFNILISFFSFFVFFSIGSFCYYLFTLINLNSTKINEYNETFVKNNLKTTHTKIETIKNNLFSLSNQIENLDQKLIKFENEISLNEFKSFNLEITSKINKIESEISNLRNFFKSEFATISNINPTPNSEEHKINNPNLINNISFIEKSLLQENTNNDLIFKIIELLKPSQLKDLKDEINFLENNSSNKIKTIHKLKEEFKFISNLMLEKTPVNKEGILENLFAWTSKSLHLRPINFGNALTPQEKISKIEHALKNNDLKLALNVFNSLPNVMKDVGNMWFYQAQNRFKFDNSITKIILYLKAED